MDIGLYEVLILLFSGSEMMLSALTKVLIVDTLRKPHSLAITSPQNPGAEITNRAGRSIMTRPGRSLQQHPKRTSTVSSLDSEHNLSPSVFSANPLSTFPAWEDRTIKLTKMSAVKTSNDLSLRDRYSWSSAKENDLVSSKGPHGHANLTKRSSERLNSSVDASGIADASRTMSLYSGSSSLTKSWINKGPDNTSSQNFHAEITPLGDGGMTVQDQNGKDDDDGVENKVSWYLILDQVCIYVPWIVIGPVCGVWSDSHGRKLPLLLHTVAHVLAVLVYLLARLWPEQLLAAVLMAGLLRGACGNHAMFITAMYSVVSDVVPQDGRSARFASLLGCRYVGSSVGMISVGILLEYFPFSCPLLVTSTVQTICFFLTLTTLTDTFTLPSSRLEDRNTSVVSMIRNFIQLWPREREYERGRETAEDGEKESDRTSLSEMEAAKPVSASSSRRVMVILALSFLTQSLWTSHREVMVQAVSLPPFRWPNSWYGYLLAIPFGTGGVAAMVLVPLLRVRVVSRHSQADVYVLVMALLCGAGGCLWSALAVMSGSNWQVFLSTSVVAVGLSSNSTCRALLSKEIGPSAQATGLAVLSVLENVAKITGTLLHTAIFVASYPTCPWLIFCLMAVEALLMLGMVYWLSTCMRDDYIVL